MNSDDPREPLVAGIKPAYHELVAGRRYLWCRCGRSKTQPFCDGSHAGTGFQPLAYVAKCDKEEALFCMCKRTGTPPFCDGAHSNLPGGYEVESAESVAASNVPWAPEIDGGVRRLDEFCYTIRAAATRPADPGPFWMRTLVDAERGAAHQTQVYVEVRDRASPILSAGAAAQTIIFIAAGTGSVEIGTQRFDVGPLDGVIVLPGEGFRMTADAGACLQVFISIYPVVAGLQTLDGHAAVRRQSAGARRERRRAAAPRNGAAVLSASRRQEAGCTQRRAVHRPHSAVESADAPPSLRRGAGHRVRRGRYLERERARAGGAWRRDLLPAQAPALPAVHVGLQGMDVVGVIHPGENPGINY